MSIYEEYSPPPRSLCNLQRDTYNLPPTPPLIRCIILPNEPIRGNSEQTTQRAPSLMLERTIIMAKKKMTGLYLFSWVVLCLSLCPHRLSIQWAQVNHTQTNAHSNENSRMSLKCYNTRRAIPLQLVVARFSIQGFFSTVPFSSI